MHSTCTCRGWAGGVPCHASSNSCGLIARVGIMLWALFALSFACKSAERASGASDASGAPYGQYVSCALMLVYIAKFYFWERW